MRFAFAILIVVVQVAGPWLCCCAPAKVSAMLSGKATPEAKPVAAAPVKSKPAECPHCRQSEPPATPTEAPVPPAPSHLPDQCPCGGAELLAVPVAVVDSAEQLVPALAEPTWSVGFVPPVLLVPASPIIGLREGPWLTTSDRLFGHHVLRC